MNLPKSASRRDVLSTQKPLPEPLPNLPKSHMSLPKVDNCAILTAKENNPLLREGLGPGDLSWLLLSLSHGPLPEVPTPLKGSLQLHCVNGADTPLRVPVSEGTSLLPLEKHVRIPVGPTVGGMTSSGC